MSRTRTSSRAAFLGRSCALLSCLAACGSGDERPTRFSPPIDANLLLISVDTLRADHLGCYGYGAPTSPVIDALAAGGHRFERAFTTMPTTLPAHAAMFVSLYPRQLGVQSNLGTLAPEATTLAERLRGAGFATGAVTGSVVLEQDTGIAQGFEAYDSVPQGSRKADDVCNRVLSWIRAHRRERFFAFTHFYDPHADYDAPPEYRQLFGVEAEGPLPGWDHLAFARKPEGLTPELVADSTRGYDAEIRFVDTEIGRLLAELEALGLREKTVIVLVSDHGETLGELIDEYAYAFDHGEFLYPRELRVPFVIWLPQAMGIESGRVYGEQVSTLDLLPTLLELLGLAPAEPIEGRSLVPLLLGGEVAPRGLVAQRHDYNEAPNDWMIGEERALVSDSWLSIHSDGRGEELYDLDRDFDVTTDRRADEPERFERMRQRLERWLERRLPVYGAEAAAPGSERDKALQGIGYADGG